MIKAKFIGESNVLIQTGDICKIKTSIAMWEGKPRLRVSFGERFRYWVHYSSVEDFLKYWEVLERGDTEWHIQRL